MARLSNSLQELKQHYEIVVIGSGYGGGVAASRLSRAGRKVLLLEKGREMQPTEYPNTPIKLAKETQLDTPGRHIGSKTGLYNLQLNPDISIFSACGLGGTSLINGGVSLRTLPRVLADEQWPEAFRAELKDGSGPFGGLEQYYRLAEDMLKPRAYPDSYPKLAKMAALKTAAAALNLPFAPVPIAVTFEPLKNGLNHVGVPQKPCIACGECAAGCNHQAKNTVLMNYLPDAKNHGAEIYTRIAVRHLERKGDQWVIHCKNMDGKNGADIMLTADTVVLAAGTLSTNEILLRSRDRGLKLSDQLGTRFSGNGDLVGWSYNTAQFIHGLGFGKHSADGRTPVGPFASSVIDARNEHDFLIIEGSFPGGMSRGVAALLSVISMRGKDTRGTRGFMERVAEKLRIVSSLLNPYSGATLRTQTYLVVNQDNNAGRMLLENDRVRVSWPGIGEDKIFERSRDMLFAGTFITNMKGPHRTQQSLLTGHPTGGAHMSDSAETGVANHKGQVYLGASGTETYPGLYVMDAALIPRSIGVNPLLTISALAERCCHHMATDRGWTIDYNFRAV
jgi:cholesterol oxidase